MGVDADLDRLSPGRLTWSTPTVDRHVIEVAGDIDRPDADRLRRMASLALESGASLEIDTARAGVFGSAALRALEEIGRIARRTGRSVAVVQRPTHVQRLLDVFEMEPDVAADPTAASERSSGRLLITSTDFDRIVAQGVLHGRESVVITTAEMDEPGPEIVFVNRAFTDVTGYSADEVLGRTPRLLQGPLTDRRVLDRLRDDVVAGRPFSGEAINYRSDGSPFVMSWRIVAVAGRSGTPSYLLAMQSDVTELRRLNRFEAALTYVDSQSAALTSAGAGSEERHQRLLEALVAAQVSLMGGGDAVARLRRRDGSSIVVATAPARFDPDDERWFATDATERVSSGNLDTNRLHIPIRLRPESSFVGGAIVLVGMHEHRLALADPRLHEQLATHAAERSF